MHVEDERLVAGLTEDERARNGVPDEPVARRRERGYRAVVTRLGSSSPLAVRVSPLGPAWSSDVDVHLPAPLDPSLPLSWGWLSLDGLLRRVGSRASGRWAATDERGRVVAAVDLHVGPPPDPVAGVLDRCRRRGEVRLREVLELRALVREGVELPSGDPVVALAADVEAGAGGDVLARAATGTPATAPAPVPMPATPAALRAVKARARRVLGPRVVVAVSGVDGAGKSTITGGLLEDLAAAGVPATLVWTRPGMGLGRLAALARAAKRATGSAPEPGVRAAAAGDQPLPRSRQGLLGWLWTTLVTLAFVAEARRRHAAARGVVVYDRHLVDAIATLRVLYRGVPLGVPTGIVRLLLPRADVTLYLDVPPAVAAARKPEDTIGRYAVGAQLEEYARLVPGAHGLLVLDAQRPADDLRAAALRHLLGHV